MRKVVRLTESDLVRIVKRVIRESENDEFDGEREESPMKLKMERAIRSIDRLDHLIKLLGGERHLDSLLSQYKPFGLSSLDDLIDYKGGYPEEEY